MSKRVPTTRKTALSTKFEDKPNKLNVLPDQVIEHIFKNVETSKSMHVATKKYTELLKQNFNNKKWLKEYLTTIYSKSSKNVDEYKLQLIPTEQSKLPTIDIIIKKYRYGNIKDSTLDVSINNDTIFYKLNPTQNMIKNTSWYEPGNNAYWWTDYDKNNKMFRDVLDNLKSVKVPSRQKTEFIKSWNKTLTAKTNK
jgi:hypothetical protein